MLNRLQWNGVDRSVVSKQWISILDSWPAWLATYNASESNKWNFIYHSSYYVAEILRVSISPWVVTERE
jgi:hypothetical protein